MKYFKIALPLAGFSLFVVTGSAIAALFNIEIVCQDQGVFLPHDNYFNAFWWSGIITIFSGSMMIFSLMIFFCFCKCCCSKCSVRFFIPFLFVLLMISSFIFSVLIYRYNIPIKESSFYFIKNFLFAGTATLYWSFVIFLQARDVEQSEDSVGFVVIFTYFYVCSILALIFAKEFDLKTKNFIVGSHSFLNRNDFMGYLMFASLILSWFSLLFFLILVVCHTDCIMILAIVLLFICTISMFVLDGILIKSSYSTVGPSNNIRKTLAISSFIVFSHTMRCGCCYFHLWL